MKFKLNETKWLVNYVMEHFLSEMVKAHSKEPLPNETLPQMPSTEWIVTFLQSKGCTVSTDDNGSLYLDFNEKEAFWNELSYG